VRIVVLDSFAADQGEDAAWESLAGLGELAVHPRTAASAIVERAHGAEAIITNKAVIGPETIAALPSLRYVGVSATGTNVVDLDAARARGIAVTNVPGYAAESVAQLTFALILHLAIDVSAHSSAVKAGRWAATEDFCFFLRRLPELSGKTLVVLGLGAIGNAVARIAAGFGMQVIAAAVPGSLTTRGRVPLADALPEADVITLHCPLTAATANLVDRKFLGQVKRGVILINTSRGGLINEADLVGALSRGHLGGVGLDVLAREPPPADHPLTDPRAPYAGRVLVTPHLGWGTVEARARVRQQVAENLGAFVAGQRLNRVD
jgi:glycerate dehydrogenase